MTVGTLCVVDTMPRTFGSEGFEALKDIGSMAEAELNRLLMQLSTLQRKGALGSLTGCWNIRGFRELLNLGFDDARRIGTKLTLRQIRMNNMEELAPAAQYSNLDAVTQLLS